MAQLKVHEYKMWRALLNEDRDIFESHVMRKETKADL